MIAIIFRNTPQAEYVAQLITEGGEYAKQTGELTVEMEKATAAALLYNTELLDYTDFTIEN